MTDIFISYSRKDTLFVREVFSVLQAQQREAWVDWQGIDYSTRWWEEICTGIERANNFVLILSPDSLNSYYCHREIEYARAEGKRIIPVLFRAVDAASIAAQWRDHAEISTIAAVAQANWDSVQQIQWIDYTKLGDLAQTIQALLETVDLDPERVQQHTRLLLRVRDWEERGRSPSVLLRGEDLAGYEAWLAQSDAQANKPHPTEAQRFFLRASRQVEDETNARDALRERRIRQFRAAALVAGGVGLLALVATMIAVPSSINASNQNATAQAQVATATNALVTSTAVAELAGTIQAEVQGAATQLHILGATLTPVGATLTPVPPTLTGVALAIANAERRQDIAIRLADTSLQLGDDPAGALAAGDALIADYPDEPLAYLSRGLILASVGQYEAALADYTEAIRLRPDEAATYVNRGNVYDDLERFDEAIADYTRAIERDPTLAQAFGNRGNSYDALGQFDEAIADYTRAIALEPTAQRYNNRGVSYFNSGRYEAAIADFTTAIARDPADERFWQRRATTYTALGDVAAAAADYLQRTRLIADIRTGPPLTLGVPEALLLEAGQSYQFALDLVAGQIGTLSAASQDDDADLVIILLAPDGSALTYNDDANRGTFNPQIADYTAPQTGRYHLLVTYFSINARSAIRVLAELPAARQTA